MLHDQHRDDFHADQERVERVGAIEQRIVLQSDAPAVLEKRLEVLIVVVQVVLVSEELLDDFEIIRVCALHVRDVGESA